MRFLSTLLALCMFAGALMAQGSDVDNRRKQLNQILDDYWEYTMRTNPEYASILGDKRYNDKLSDASYAAVLRDLDETRKYVARLEAVDTAGFPEQEQLNKELLLRQLKMGLEGARFKTWEMPVNQFSGIHIDAPQLVNLLSFETVKDYEDFIARLNLLPLVFDQTEDLMRMGMKSGRIPPKILLDQVVKQAKGLAETKAEDSPFAGPVKKFPDGISAADQKRLHDAVITAISTKVTPAYEEFTKFVADEYAPKGRTDPGAWSLPDGEALYAFMVKQSTTTDKTPEEIHQLGLQQVAADRAAMLEIAKKMGYSDLKSFEATIKDNPKLHAQSRQQILDIYQKYEDQMWAKLPELFGTLPKAKVIVMPVEEFREKEASAAQYNSGTPDGKRPGHIMVNTGDFAKRLTIDMESTAYHEGVPGHHLQGSIAQEIPTLPKFRQQAYYTAYVEGWALYSERLGKEVGFYQDPYNDYGRLQDDLLRAIRLVVDTGFHYKKWTRQQVVDYFHNNSAIDEVNVQSETDRYIAWPAQALGYKMGQLKFIELRERSKQELGAKFDIRKYHDEVIDSGALPLDVLERRVNSWIAEQK
ncbi:protein of unknown function DUF885 [Candidatus Koribacter versatilis Ellin345]|uniref:DUF885 domain-containing protein n=1 Tax=Koribacter versatilis (strain Ellin345) TaxID=204669 RepID=Q1IMI6_KORVE|nr:DUF885 domain-containing protein [Candidatus Koribacter versatilis]ABF41914.1 protein of unknown function DUF885 [Candidatus Koribacter versatilis Ellin345]